MSLLLEVPLVKDLQKGNQLQIHSAEVPNGIMHGLRSLTIHPQLYVAQSLILSQHEEPVCQGKLGKLYEKKLTHALKIEG